MKKLKVTIVGAGNGGTTAAYHIASRGHEVCLFDSKKFPKGVENVKKHNNQIIAVSELHETKMNFPGVQTITKTTTDPKEAAGFSEYLIFIVPSFAQEIMFDELLPFLNDNHKIVLMPGNYGSLVLKHKINNSKYSKLNLTFVDAISIPWACRLVEDNKIAILGLKEYLPISIWPKTNSKTILKDLNDIFPLEITLLNNPIVSGLENINYGGHPLMTVCNIGLLENFDGKFNYYRDCCSTATANACIAMDNERLAVGKSFGWNLKPELEAMNTLYDSHEKTVYDFNRNSVTHVKLQSAPSNSHHRYIIEDTAYLLVPCYQLAKKANIEVPIVESIVRLASAYNNEDYFKTGRTLAKMGLDDMSLNDIKNLMEQ